MKIKFWGCRGSIPVADNRMMKYGGNTTCLEVWLDDRLLIIDAGTGIRLLGEQLVKNNVKNIDVFITHSHWDHIMGFPFFMPIYNKDVKIRIFGCTSSYKKLQDIFAGQMSYEYFPVSFSDLKSEIQFQETCGDKYRINNHTIKTIQTNHPIYTTGIRIEKDNKSFVFITDNELNLEKPKTKPEKFIEFCSDADYLIHDAQFTDMEYPKHTGWGHSTFEQVIALAKESNAKNAGFYHHGPDRKDIELDGLLMKYSHYCTDNNCNFSIFAVKEMQEIEL